MKLIKTYGFDPGTARDIGELFLPEASKTLTNGTCPGWHNAILEIKQREQNMLQNWDGTQVSPTLTQNNAGGGRECLIRIISIVL